ncbi:hypothetical protein, partial [Neisseria sp. P0022.S010]|uniref:hypothetical protein n=1 Tax=Neisseria sp. P0022.S010 TaxID=3436835 RepID=UPI003F7ED469
FDTDNSQIQKIKKRTKAKGRLKPENLFSDDLYLQYRLPEDYFFEPTNAPTVLPLENPPATSAAFLPKKPPLTWVAPDCSNLLPLIWALTAMLSPNLASREIVPVNFLLSKLAVNSVRVIS